MQKHLLRCLAGVCACLTASVISAAPVDLPRMERAIALRVSTGQFMGSVLVARDGKVLIDKGYGLADLASKTPNATKTKFRLGSVRLCVQQLRLRAPGLFDRKNQQCFIRPLRS